MAVHYRQDRIKGLNARLAAETDDAPLASIKNRTMKNLVKVMKDGGLGASAIRAYTNVVKMVLSSAVDHEGEVLYPHIREHGVPKDLEHFWMGHEDEEIGDIYSMLRERVAYRKKWAEQAGLGFEIPSKTAPIGLNGPKIENEGV
jgi:hypothetical protein